MQKTTIALVFGLAGLAAGSWLSTASSAAGTSYGVVVGAAFRRPGRGRLKPAPTSIYRMLRAW